MMFWLSIQVIGLYFIHINCQSSIIALREALTTVIFVVPYKGQAAEAPHPDWKSEEWIQLWLFYQPN